MKESNIRVFLADDHPFLLEGLTLMLETVPDIEVIGEARNGQEVLEKMEQLAIRNELPDVILMDVDMPALNGYQATAALMQKYQRPKVFMLTIFDSELDIKQAKKVGASGFLSKRINKKEIVQAIRDCLTSGSFIVHNPAASSKAAVPIPEKEEKKFWLTERERRLIELIAKEVSPEGIASQLKLSNLSFSALRKTILSKLNVTTDAGIVREAISRGLISTTPKTP